ncbi:1,3-beta-glucanosyltransferase gas1 [Phlyctochytrium bullatum]|nr:1,3-beta-glucanosyltransferase gas1 [Phlyctochytrium bullatum]
MAYQPRSRTNLRDPIMNSGRDEWFLHLKIMQGLGINTIRVYEVDPSAQHDAFMKELQQREMYLLLDLGRQDFSLNREQPSYTYSLFKRYTETFDAFANYSNVLGYFAGNEVINSKATASAAPYTKALIRDLKRYAQRFPRYIPIGYASSDDSEIRLDSITYFSCGEDEETVDFFGLNMYEWCGNSTYESSGFKDRTQEMKYSTAPVIVSEYGCNAIRPRIFTEVEAIFGPEMLQENGYGIIQRNSGGVGFRPVPYEFTNFKNRMEAALEQKALPSLIGDTIASTA